MRGIGAPRRGVPSIFFTIVFSEGVKKSTYLARIGNLLLQACCNRPVSSQLFLRTALCIQLRGNINCSQRLLTGNGGRMHSEIEIDIPKFNNNDNMLSIYTYICLLYLYTSLLAGRLRRFSARLTFECRGYGRVPKEELFAQKWAILLAT